MQQFLSLALAALLAACASATHGPVATTPLTSVDTAYYVVPGVTRTEWAIQLPRAAERAGIRGGLASFTVGHVLWHFTGTGISSRGCELDGSVVSLRLGQVMPRLAAGAAPSAAERAAWDAFVESLWERAHAREEIGARMADSLRAELKRSPTSTCAELVAIDRQKVTAFPARYMAAVQAAEEARGVSGQPEVP